MPHCLLGLGSNVGDREASLAAALAAIDALPDVRLRRHSEWQRTRPVGGPAEQGEYLNGAAVIDTTIAPLILLKELQQIEERLGRRPSQRWSERTIDIDILLYDREVLDQSMITVPHPRLSFRRFVLEPASEVAPKMMHPIIGWPVERLLLHLNRASDLAAVMSPSETLRCAVSDMLIRRCAAQTVDEPALGTAGQHWPNEWTTWLAINLSRKNDPPAGPPAGLPYAAATFPRLTILLDPEPATPRPILSKWSPIVRQPGRGPTLRIPHGDDAIRQLEVAAAIESVWPDLGPK